MDVTHTLEAFYSYEAVCLLSYIAFKGTQQIKLNKRKENHFPRRSFAKAWEPFQTCSDLLSASLHAVLCPQQRQEQGHLADPMSWFPSAATASFLFSFFWQVPLKFTFSQQYSDMVISAVSYVMMCLRKNETTKQQRMCLNVRWGHVQINLLCWKSHVKRHWTWRSCQIS